MNSIDLHDITKIVLGQTTTLKSSATGKPFHTRQITFYTGSIKGHKGVIQITAYGRMKNSLKVEANYERRV